MKLHEVHVWECGCAWDEIRTSDRERQDIPVIFLFLNYLFVCLYGADPAQPGTLHYCDPTGQTMNQYQTEATINPNHFNKTSRQ